MLAVQLRLRSSMQEDAEFATIVGYSGARATPGSPAT